MALGIENSRSKSGNDFIQGGLAGCHQLTGHDIGI